MHHRGRFSGPHHSPHHARHGAYQHGGQAASVAGLLVDLLTTPRPASYQAADGPSSGQARSATTSPQGLQPSELRVSHAERDAVAQTLSHHCEVGRLDLAEFDDRLGRALVAKTRGDLDALVADLPDPGPERPARRRPGWRSMLIAPALTAVVMLLALALVLFVA